MFRKDRVDDDNLSNWSSLIYNKCFIQRSSDIEGDIAGISCTKGHKSSADIVRLTKIVESESLIDQWIKSTKVNLDISGPLKGFSFLFEVQGSGDVIVLADKEGCADLVRIVCEVGDCDGLLEDLGQGSVGVIVGDIDDDDFVDGSGLVDDERVV